MSQMVFPEEPDRLLVIEEVMSILRLSRRQVRTLMSNGTLQAIQFSPRIWRFKQSEIDNLLTGGDSEKENPVNAETRFTNGELQARQQTASDVG